MAEDLGRIDINRMFSRGGSMPVQNTQVVPPTQDPNLANPYQGYKDHPFLMGLSTMAMGIGEGMTGRPFLTNFNNNLHEQKQAQLKYKQWQEEQRIAREKLEADAKQQVPLITIGKNGEPVMQGMIPKGSVVRQDPETIVNIARAKSEIPTADMKNQLKTAQQASALISDLRAQAETLKGGYAGILKQGEAFVTRGAGKSGDYKMYEDLSKSGAVAFYRAVTGDTRLSDQDAADRAYPLMWKTDEDESLKGKKFDFLERMIDARQELLSSGKYSEGDVIPISVLKQKAQKMESTSGAPEVGSMFNGAKVLKVERLD